MNISLYSYVYIYILLELLYHCIVSPRWWKTTLDRWFCRCNPWNPFPKSWKTQREGPQGFLFWQKNLTQNGLEMAGKWFLNISELGIMSISCMKWTSDLGMILIVSLLSGWSLREETRKWRFGLWWLWKVLWLVVNGCHQFGIFPEILGISSSQLTHIFQRGGYTGPPSSSCQKCNDHQFWSVNSKSVDHLFNIP